VNVREYLEDKAQCGWFEFYAVIEGLPLAFKWALSKKFVKGVDCIGAARRLTAEAVEFVGSLGAAAHIGFDDSEIRDAADWCSGVAVGYSHEDLVSLCVAVGVDGLAENTAANVARMGCRRWWLRRLRVSVARSFERGAGALNLYGGKKGKYCSDFAVRWRRDACDRNELSLKNTNIVNKLTGETLNLFDVAAGTVSNPEIRRNELMTRISGFEALADSRGWKGDFYTLTASSRYHRVLFSGGDNPFYGGGDPRDGQEFLTRAWGLARARIKKAGMDWFGFRVAEPHHDGCPHWHLILWSDRLGEIRRIIRESWLRFDGGDIGAFHNRVKVKRMVKEIVGKDGIKKSVSAAGYVAKYISKNIDGVGLDFSTATDDDGGQVQVSESVADSAARVDAWAALWGIRQFQQFGGGRVGVWRELRRLRVPVAVGGVLESARSAADAGDWKRYCELSGALKLIFEPEKLGFYGDVVSGSVRGVGDDVGRVVETHCDKWEVVYLPEDCRKRAGVVCSGSGSTWSPVNNCNPPCGGAVIPVNNLDLSEKIKRKERGRGEVWW